MTGNIMKTWWRKCRINPKLFLGNASTRRYKKVLDCPTDSEDLIFTQGRSSSCSAPPDLLILNENSDKANLNSENCKSKEEAQKINMKKKHKQSTNLDSKNAANDKVLLDEFTCDISVESSATSQPFQFSFTFYDLDGHHGKITKDDIAGIVYTIYESIGKSMRVPCYGSKTINVKLTVSQENNIKKRKGTMSKYTTQNNGRKSNINCVNKQKSGGNVDVKNDLKTDHSTPEISNKRNNMEAFAKLNSKQDIKQKQNVRKSRRQKKTEYRQRSLSVGNEASWRYNSRNICKLNYRIKNNTQFDVNVCNIGGSAGDLENTQHISTCSNNGLKRNELIDIIRESMEKNRLCFQQNGKHVGNKNNKSNCNMTIPSFKDTHEKLQPHIPIYQQQLAINPALLLSHHKDRNLCGYDSFLHEQICNRDKILNVSDVNEENSAFSPNLSYRRKMQSINLKDYLDIKSKKNVENNLLYSKLSKKSKDDINIISNDNKSFSLNKDKKTDGFYNIELENLISSSDEEYKEDQHFKANSTNETSSISSSMVRYVHEHIHHHYHHFENQDD